MWKNAVLIAGLAALAACAPMTKRPTVDSALIKIEAEKQRALVVDQYLKDTNRLNQVTYPVLKANSELCGKNTAYHFGGYVINRDFFSKEYRSAALKNADIGEVLRIQSIARNSAASRAGMEVGDRIITIGNKDAPTGEKAINEFYELFGNAAEESSTVDMTILRGGKNLDISIKPDVICNYGYSIEINETLNAYADGKRILISSAMIRFLPDDNDLALVVSHEVAHNQMEHIRKGKDNTNIGIAADLLFAVFGVNTQGSFANVGASAYSQEFEFEADYVGMYMSARAGFEIENAANIWRRMAATNPSGIQKSGKRSHPSSPERFVALEKTTDEINAKRAANLPLLPEMEEN